MASALLIFLTVFLIWIVAVMLLWKKNVLERFNISLIGPILMLRTNRGKGFLDRLARPKRFWRGYGNVGIVLMGVMMVAMLFLLVMVAMTASNIPKEDAPNARMLVGIPVVNPLIPLWYGILGLAVGIVVHEFSHGIMARAGKIKVKSMGILLCIFPIGAFVEPDEEELAAASKPRRARVYAVGPLANLIVALICAMLFSTVMMGAVEPVAQGTGIVGILDGGPAEMVGLKPGMILTEVNGTAIEENADFFEAMDRTKPGQDITVKVAIKGGGAPQLRRVCLGYNLHKELFMDEPWYAEEQGYFGVEVVKHPDGVQVVDVQKWSPADRLGVGLGDIILYFDDIPVSNPVHFRNLVNVTHGGQSVEVSFRAFHNSSEATGSVRLGIAKGLIGVSVAPIVIDK